MYLFTVIFVINTNRSALHALWRESVGEEGGGGWRGRGALAFVAFLSVSLDILNLSLIQLPTVWKRWSEQFQQTKGNNSAGQTRDTTTKT